MNITRSTGNNKPLRWLLYIDSPKEPSILTGHSLSLVITDSLDADTAVSGTLYSGDAGVYFDVPDTVYDVAGTYTYKLNDTDTNADVLTVDTGTIVYS